jgi:short-subunit dehydrogenase
MSEKIVVITGASSGIGEALAREYALRGDKLSLGARRLERLEDFRQGFPDHDILITKTDVSVEQDCKNLIERTIEHFGRIDVLINNAGISMRALFKDVNLEVMHKIMDVNFYGTVYCTKYAMPWLLDTKGSLVGVISIAGHVGLPGRSAYSASKFAIRGFLDVVRLENLYKGLHVLVAAPGFTATEVRKVALSADGSQQGESPRDENKMMSAETCAHLIIRAIDKRKRSLILTFTEGKFTVFLGKFFPALLDKLAFHHFAKEKDSPLKD